MKFAAPPAMDKPGLNIMFSEDTETVRELPIRFRSGQAARYPIDLTGEDDVFFRPGMDLPAMRAA